MVVRCTNIHRVPCQGLTHWTLHDLHWPRMGAILITLHWTTCERHSFDFLKFYIFSVNVRLSAPIYLPTMLGLHVCRLLICVFLSERIIYMIMLQEWALGLQFILCALHYNTYSLDLYSKLLILNVLNIITISIKYNVASFSLVKLIYQ